MKINIQKVDFMGFMLSPEFVNFNNKELPEDFPLNEQILKWSNQQLASNISKLTNELLRRDIHGVAKSRFTEDTRELHLLLSILTTLMEIRLTKEPN